MKVSTFERVVVEPAVEPLQQNIERFVEQFYERDGQLAVLSDDLELSAGVTYLYAHGLGREPVGWRVVDQTSFGTVVRDASSTEPKSKFLALQANADMTIRVEVF